MWPQISVHGSLFLAEFCKECSHVKVSQYYHHSEKNWKLNWKWAMTHTFYSRHLFQGCQYQLQGKLTAFTCSTFFPVLCLRSSGKNMMMPVFLQIYNYSCMYQYYISRQRHNSQMFRSVAMFVIADIPVCISCKIWTYLCLCSTSLDVVVH
jgi:hypothetical protein